MYKLKFDENLCAMCSSFDCLVKCQYMQLDKKMAHDQVMKIINSEDSFVLQDCVTCYSCEEYCPLGNHPFYLISERREEKGMLLASRPITNQQIRLCEFQGKYRIGEVREEALSACFIPELQKLATGKLFDGISSSYIYGAEYFCQVMFLHYAKPSVIKDKLPQVIGNVKRLGVKKLICMHDECYGSFTSLAEAYGIEVPFEPIHYLEYIFGRLKDLKGDLRRLNVKVIYQRPCSSRLSPNKSHFVEDILDVIGAELIQRKYQRENALCCGEIPRTLGRYELANDIQRKNVEDMVEAEADYCVFNCPYCQMALSEKVSKRGIKPIHIIDMCKMALGEKQTDGGK
jgi:Fe-S oxidoreductase